MDRACRAYGREKRCMQGFSGGNQNKINKTVTALWGRPLYAHNDNCSYRNILPASWWPDRVEICSNFIETEDFILIIKTIILECIIYNIIMYQ